MAPRRTPHELLAIAKANGYRRGEHREEDQQTGLRKYAPTVEGANEAVLYLYASWCFNQAEEKYERVLKDGSTGTKPPDFETVQNAVLRENMPAPSIEDVKDFMRFVKASSKGLISKKIQARSLRTYAENFYRAFQVKTRTEIDKAHKKEMYHWIWHYLPSIGEIEKRSKPKYNFGVRDLDRVLVALWCKATFVHERLRVETHFLFLLDISAGPRIAALFKGGVRYKDIQLVQTRREDGSYGWYWKWDQRYVKNNPDPDHFWLGIAGSDHRILRYDNATFILSMAFADNALYGYNTPDDLWEQEIPDGDTETILLWNDDVLELPIVRAIGKDGIVSDSKLSQSTFCSIFGNALDLAGYVGVSPSLHQIRRQVGKEIDELYTEAQRGQILGQKDPNIFGRSYVANCTSVDGRSAFLGETPNHKPHEYFQSLEIFHENGVPNSLPHVISLQIEDDPRIQGLIRQISETEDPSEKENARTALSSLRNKLSASELGSYRKKWLEERRKQKILTRGKLPPMESEPSLELIDPIPEREKIATMVLHKAPLGQTAMRQAVDYLHTLCTRDSTVRYYRGEEPLNGLCQFCSAPMSSIQGSKSSHAHKCCKKSLAKRWGFSQSKLRFCFICAEWFIEGAQWENHCLTHLEKPLLRCGSTVIRRTVIRPAYCPFHLVSDRSPSERMRAWNRDADAIRHIKDEEVRNEYPTSCCGAVLMTETDLDCHLVDVHGFHIRTRPASGQDETDSKRDIAATKDMSPDIKDKFHRALFTSFESISPTPRSKHLLGSDPVSQATLLGSEPISQTSSWDLKSGSEPPEFMWQYVSLSPSPSRLPSPLLEQPIGIHSENFSDSDGSTRRSLTALRSVPDLSSSSTTSEPTSPDEDFSRASPSRPINSTSELGLIGNSRSSPPPQLLSCASSSDTSTFDLNLFGHGDGTDNAPTDLAVSPKEIFPDRARDSQQFAEDKDTPPSRRIILKTTGSRAHCSSAGSRKPNKRLRNTASSQVDDRADPPKRRRIVLKNKPEAQGTALPKRIVLKVKG